jgi:hypothetical protein
MMMPATAPNTTGTAGTLRLIHVELHARINKW